MNLTFAAISIIGSMLAGSVAVFVLARNPRDQINRLFFAFAQAVAFLDLFDFLTKISASNDRALFFLRLHVICWLLFVAFLFHFVLILAKRDKILSNWFSYLFIYGLVPVMGYINWNSRLFYYGVIREPWGYSQQFAGGYWILAFYSVAYFLALMYFGWQAWRQADTRREQKQKYIILVSFICSFIVAFPFEVIARFMGINIPPLIPVLPVVIILFFSYAMVRYGLLIISPAMLAQNIIETMPDMLVYTDKDRVVRLINRGFGEALNYTDEYIIGRSCSTFHADGEAHQKLHELISRQGIIGKQRATLKGRDGSLIEVNVSASIVRNSLGEETGSVVIYHDISSEQRLAAEQQQLVAELTKTKERMLSILEDTTATRDEIKELYEDLKAVDKMKTEFLSVISHELRTPLTPILGYLSMFLSEQCGKLPPEYLQQAQIMKKESEHLVSLIDSILDVSRLERGIQLSVDKKPILLRALLADLQAVFKPDYDARQIKLEVDLPADFPTIIGDGSKLHRLFTNLLGNALKFAPRGGWVRVSGRPAGDQVIMEVSDNGIGLAPENLIRIFDKFYQVDGTYTRATGGVGLGLAIAREIVEAHGGRIRAESPGLGMGTKIIFTLPIMG
jgi:PAS domain S-box-containing protein